MRNILIIFITLIAQFYILFCFLNQLSCSFHCSFMGCIARKYINDFLPTFYSISVIKITITHHCNLRNIVRAIPTSTSLMAQLRSLLNPLYLLIIIIVNNHPKKFTICVIRKSGLFRIQYIVTYVIIRVGKRTSLDRKLDKGFFINIYLVS